MEEITVNLHNHSALSDGTGTYSEIARSAIDACVDVVIVTDHNVLVQNKDAYYYADGRKVLLLTGEEIHDPAQKKGHLLSLNCQREMSTFAEDKQRLCNLIAQNGGISVIAHPFDKPLRFTNHHSFEWIDWQVNNFDGLEIANYLSEFKSNAHNLFDLLNGLFHPLVFSLGPDPQAVLLWDELLCDHRRVLAFAGSDAHNLKINLGPFSFNVFPYVQHFRALNNHLLIEKPLSGDANQDRETVYQALKQGRFYIGFDCVQDARGFDFHADGKNKRYYQGDQMIIEDGATLKIRNPRPAISRLIHNGNVINQWENLSHIPVTITEPGYYRVESYLPKNRKLRGWIYSNPIFVAKGVL